MVPIENPRGERKQKQLGSPKYHGVKVNGLFFGNITLEEQVKDVVEILIKLKTYGEKWGPMKEQPKA